MFKVYLFILPTSYIFKNYSICNDTILWKVWKTGESGGAGNISNSVASSSGYQHFGLLPLKSSYINTCFCFYYVCIIRLCMQMYTYFFNNISIFYIYQYKIRVLNRAFHYSFLLKTVLMVRRGNQKHCPPLKVALRQINLVESNEAKPGSEKETSHT